MTSRQKKSQQQQTNPTRKRKLALPSYSSFRFSKSVKQPKPPLKGGFRLFWVSLQPLFNHKRLYGSLLLIAFIANLLLVRGLSNVQNLNDLKHTLDTAFMGQANPLFSSATLFSILLSGSANSPSATATVYQTILTILFSLAFIWALRQTSSLEAVKIRIRDPFYKGMYPL